MAAARYPWAKGMLLVIIAAMVIPAYAKGKAKRSDTRAEQIEILAHLPINGSPIVRFTMARDHNRSYLYLEHASRKITFVDITDAQHPKAVSNLNLPASGDTTVLAAAGDAVLIGSENTNAGRSATPLGSSEKSMTLVSFADPAHPKTIRQFDKVSCTGVDPQRSLMFVVNDEGLWIIRRNAPDDPDAQERYAHEVLYNH